MKVWRVRNNDTGKWVPKRGNFSPGIWTRKHNATMRCEGFTDVYEVVEFDLVEVVRHAR